MAKGPRYPVMHFAMTAKERKEAPVYENITVTPETELYQLLGRFMLSNTPLLIVEETYEGCLNHAKKMIEFLRREHLAHRTGWEFSERVIGDKIIVNGMKPGNYRQQTRLYLTLEIVKKIKRSDYDSSLIAERKESIEVRI